MTKKLDINKATSQLTCVKTSGGHLESAGSDMIVQWYEGQDDESTTQWHVEIGRGSLVINSMSEIAVDQVETPLKSGKNR